MPFRELNRLQREAYLKEKIRQLRILYGAQQRRLAIIASAVDLTDFNRSRAEQLLKEVDRIVTVLNKGIHEWAKSAVPESYVRGLDLAAERLKALGVTRFVNKSAQIHTSAVNVLIDEITVSMITANNSIGQTFNRYIRQTQQRILEDSQISRMVADGIITGESRRAVSDVILKQLRKQLNNQHFIRINGRNYRPDSYAELVARTRTREATTQGSINTALRYGVDLVQVDLHNEPCAYCQQFSGRVFSLSGSDPDFPQLNERPPFHPNCLCVLVPVTRNTLERRGYLDELIKLSNSPSTEIGSHHRFEEVLAAL